MSLFIVSMDATVVNVALPAISRDLNASISDLQWIVDGYTLTLASFLLLSGSTADRLGRRRVFQVGLVVFSIGSLLCSVAPSIGFLIFARVLQALGGSMLNPVAMSIITNTFTEKKARARAVGVWGAIVGVSMAFGPLVGGALTETVGWRSVFWVNVPVGVAAIILCAIFVPESRATKARKLDPIGQLLVIVALVSLVFGLIEGTRQGWGSPLIIGLFVLSAVAVVLLLRHESRTAQPFVDLRFFQSVPFSSATIIALCAFAAYGAFLFINALYLQDVRGLSAFETGIYMLPLAIATLVCSLISGRLVGRFGTRPSLVIAGTLLAASAVSLTFLTATTPDAQLLVSYVLFGLGFGMVNAPITTTAVSGMPLSQAGVAAGLASTSRQVGVSVGVALAGTVTGAGASAMIGAGFATATHAMWWIVVGCGLTIAALGIASTTAWARQTTEKIGHLLAEPVATGAVKVSATARGAVQAAASQTDASQPTSVRPAAGQPAASHTDVITAGEARGGIQ
ncbi:DHA2 family efflux MFS transporter permease subunit [Subtercola vilae]|uniref:DHA2 family efflux MFS transporter permease subunit n=2 Tax=Subtercola vilae TaxID=2056433 RepID=A0A4T2CAX0_9MICO|nr:DHA2 family efflux MFS transporter permease subunit [Subtercola vilae]